MSFILDALKKSELERQRQTTPGLVESGMARPRPRLPGWAIALGILLAINFIVLLVVLTRSWWSPHAATGSDPAASPSATNAPAAAARATASPAAQSPTAASAEATDKHFSPLDASPVYAPEIPLAAAPPASTTTQAPATRAPAETWHAIRRQDPLLNDNDYKADDDEVLPTINEINLTGAEALPELHLDVHVFATKATERFVFVNMRKYHEGATLQEGPTIERIRRDGVILNYRGLRFLLPRQ
jgi:general secretion pathway protein B